MDASRHKQQVGDRLRLVREALGYDGRGGQARFAAYLGLPRDKLSAWERGKHYPDAMVLQRLWREFRVSADYLYASETGNLPHALAARLPSGEAES